MVLVKLNLYQKENDQIADYLVLPNSIVLYMMGNYFIIMRFT
jgi:hypothetical protein